MSEKQKKNMVASTNGGAEYLGGGAEYLGAESEFSNHDNGKREPDIKQTANTNNEN